MNHSQIDARSLEFCKLIAERLRDNPSLIQHARQNIDRWLITSSPNAARTLDEWKRALELPLEQVIELLTATDERSTRLRQSNPFAGVLTPQERNDIIRRFQQHDPATT